MRTTLLAIMLAIGCGAPTAPAEAPSAERQAPPIATDEPASLETDVPPTRDAARPSECQRECVQARAAQATTPEVIEADCARHCSKPRPDVSASLVVALDRSGSMSGPKMMSAKAAIKAGVRALPAGSEFGLVIFDRQATQVLPLSPASSPTIDTAIDRITVGGGTNIDAGLKWAADALEQSGHRVRHVLLLSDGHSPTGKLLKRASEMAQRGITLTTVGIGDADAKLLAAVASAAGGMFIKADLSELSQVFENDVKRATAP
jgi:Mg-chelatase subunit ChlD